MNLSGKIFLWEYSEKHKVVFSLISEEDKRIQKYNHNVNLSNLPGQNEACVWLWLDISSALNTLWDERDRERYECLVIFACLSAEQWSSLTRSPHLNVLASGLMWSAVSQVWCWDFKDWWCFTLKECCCETIQESESCLSANREWDRMRNRRVWRHEEMNGRKDVCVCNIVYKSLPDGALQDTQLLRFIRFRIKLATWCLIHWWVHLR